MVAWRMEFRPGAGSAPLVFMEVHLNLGTSGGAARLAGSAWKAGRFGIHAIGGGVIAACDPRCRYEFLAALAGVRCLLARKEPFNVEKAQWEEHRHMLETMREKSMCNWWRLPACHHARFANLAAYMITGIIGGFGPATPATYLKMVHIEKAGLIGINPEAAAMFAEEWAYPADSKNVPIREIEHGKNSG